MTLPRPRSVRIPASSAKARTSSFPIARALAAIGVVAVAAIAGPGAPPQAVVIDRAEAVTANVPPPAVAPARPADDPPRSDRAQPLASRVAPTNAFVSDTAVEAAGSIPPAPSLVTRLRHAWQRTQLVALQPYLPALHAAGATRLSPMLAGHWQRIAPPSRADATPPQLAQPKRIEPRVTDTDTGTDASTDEIGLRMLPPGGVVLSEAGSRPQLVTASMDLSGVNTSSTAYTRFRTWVENAVAGSPGYDFHPGDAALMYRITRDVRYCNTAVAMVEQQVLAAETDIAAQRNPEVAGDSYLEVGPMIADLSLTYSSCAAQMTTAQRTRWATYAEQAVWNVWNHTSARWGSRSAPWSGWSVTNPGNNYHYSFLEATMYWALASGSGTWMNFLTTNKLPTLQNYYTALPGGGSLEGTGYGTAQMRLFEIYRLWRDSTGNDLSLASTHARNNILYWAHATVPTMNMFAPIGDQSRNSVPELYDYHRHLMLEARNLTYDARLREIASWWLGNITVRQMGQGANFRFDAVLPAGSGGSPPTELHYAAQGTGMVFARTGWDANAMWLSYIAGPYNESHAHQDQGAFTLYSRGAWLAVTENIWSRSGIQQGPEVHNTLRFERSNPAALQCTSPQNDRIVHQCGNTISTSTVTPGSNGALSITSNLTPAYYTSNYGSPYVLSWQRRLDFANRSLTVLDNFSTGSGTTATFQVQVPVSPTVSGNTVTAGGLRIRVLQPANPTISVRNWNTVNSNEFTRGYRVDIGGGTSVYQVEFTEI